MPSRSPADPLRIPAVIGGTLRARCGTIDHATVIS